MPPLSETAQGPSFLKSEANGSRSRSAITVAQSQTLLAGAVIAAMLTGAATVTPTAAAGNTGDGSIGTVTADTLAPAGDYKVLIIEPAANGGTFAVYKPDGVLEGTGTIGVAYNGSINFTLGDGATDFAAGDNITVNVAYAAGSLQYVAHNPSGTDGSQIAAGVLYDAVTTGAGETAEAVAVVVDAEVWSDRLVWGSHTTNQKNAALATLASLGIVAR